MFILEDLKPMGSVFERVVTCATTPCSFYFYMSCYMAASLARLPPVISAHIILAWSMNVS